MAAIFNVDINPTARARIKKLPAPAQKIFQDYGAIDRQLNGACHERDLEIARLTEEEAEASRAIGSHDHMFSRQEQPKEAQAARAKLVEERKELRAQRAARAAEKLPISKYQELISEGIARSPHKYKIRLTKLEDRPDHSPLELYEMTRGAILDFQNQLNEDAALPLTQAEGVPVALAALDALAAKGRPDVSGCFKIRKQGRNREKQGAIRWPMKTVPDPDAIEPKMEIDAAALCAWANYDQIKAKIVAECEKRDDPDALSADERKEREASKRAIIRDLEYQLYQRVFVARAAGFKDVIPPQQTSTGSDMLDQMSGDGILFNWMAALGIERDTAIPKAADDADVFANMDETADADPE